MWFSNVRVTFTRPFHFILKPVTLTHCWEILISMAPFPCPYDYFKGFNVCIECIIHSENKVKRVVHRDTERRLCEMNIICLK